MSRRRTEPREHRAEAHARDLLVGRIAAGPDALLEAIHQVNPTGRALDPADERRRYELKAQLQSLLIRTLHDDLVITADAPGVVAIRHRYLGRDACHARIDELDDEARARVRWALDVAEPAAPESDRIAAVARTETAGAAGLLAEGRAALAAFDYDAARLCFEQAALGASDDPAAARELLELLVDHLALDDQALALEARLPQGALASREVRALLAVAAARLDDAVAAQRLLTGLAGPRAADAWAALADHALVRRASAELDVDVARLTEADPAHPELVRLRDAATRLRGELRGPDEQALAQLAEQGDDAAVEAAARALLVRWPDSRVAGRLLGGLLDRQRVTEAERLVARARGAIADGDLAHAGELARQARAAGADTAALVDELRATEAARRALHDEAEVTAVCARLTSADLRAGLVAFVALEPELRGRVQARVGTAMLAWISQIDPRPKPTRHGAIVDGVLAIAAAAEALDRDAAADALAILEPHEPVVGGLARARELRALAMQRIAARRRADAAAALASAGRALAAGDLELCERLCGQADGRELDAAHEHALDQLRRNLHERRDAARRDARIDELVAAGDLVAARHELERVPGVPGEATRARLAALRAEIACAWQLTAEDVRARPAPVDPIGELLGILPYAEWIAPWLVAGGRELIAAGSYGRHVFIARVSVDDGRLVDRRYVHPPEPLGALVSTAVDGDLLWLFGETGRVLQLSWATGEPVRWFSLAPLVGTERIQHVFTLPGSAYLWCASDIPGGVETERLIEIEGLRVRRAIPRSRRLQAVLAGSSSYVLGTGFNGGAVRYTERGAIAGEIAALVRVQVSSAACDPAGELVVLGSPPDQEDDDDHDAGDDGMSVLRLRAGRVIHREPVPDAFAIRPNRCAAARVPGLLFVHHSAELDDARVTAWRFTESALEPLYIVDAPSFLPLAQDGEAAEVVGMWDSPRRVEVMRFGELPPSFEAGLRCRARWDLPKLDGYFSCGPHAAQDPDSERLVEADRLARGGAWAEVRALLEDVPLDSVAAACSDHHRHLLGVAWLRTGVAATQVHALWAVASSGPGEDRLFSCQLEVCLGLVEPMPDPLPDAWWGDDAPALHQLRGAIATADRCLAAADAEAALGAVRRRIVTRSRELQSWARMAAAWLARASDADEDRFGKAIALAQFVALRGQGGVDLPIEGAWSEERLAKLVEEAERWLGSWRGPRG